MMTEGLKQILDWSTESITAYCEDLTGVGIAQLSDLYTIESSAYRAKHLFGIRIKEHMDLDLIKARLQAANISVSYRGDCIRVSPHVYNEKDEFQLLVDTLITQS